MVEVEKGIRRHTFSLPLGIDHVHCYFLRSSSGGWILVDTGLGRADPEALWQPVLAALDGPVEAIVVSHMHPDHVGGARDVARLTSAPVLQGREDHAQCARAWGGHDSELFLTYWRLHGMPADLVESMREESARFAAAVHWVEHPDRLLDAGDTVDGWRVEVLRGHADGHIVLERDGVLIAGDTILAGITPAIGLYPNSRPDPLGDYQASLRRLVELAPRVAYAGHGASIEDVPARARTISAHHDERLARTLAALSGEPRLAYDVSLSLFPGDLSPQLRRFATAESLAHLERLRVEGKAHRVGAAYVRGPSLP